MRMKKSNFVKTSALAAGFLILFCSNNVFAYSTVGCPYPIPASLQYPGLIYNTTPTGQSTLVGPNGVVSPTSGTNPCAIFSDLPIPGNGSERLMDALPPPSTVPTTCTNPSQAKTALDSWEKDFEELLSYGGTPGQGAEVNCNGNVTGILDASDSWNSNICGKNAIFSGGGYTCESHQKYTAAVNKYQSCVQSYVKNNPSSVSDATRYATFEAVQADHGAFVSACKDPNAPVVAQPGRNNHATTNRSPAFSSGGAFRAKTR